MTLQELSKRVAWLIVDTNPLRLRASVEEVLSQYKDLGDAFDASNYSFSRLVKAVEKYLNS